MPKYTIVSPILLNGVILYFGEVELNGEEGKRLVDLEVIQETEGEKTVEEMTVPELKQYAKDNEIDIGDAKKQKEILDVIKAYEDQKQEGDK